MVGGSGPEPPLLTLNGHPPACFAVTHNTPRI
jgi:hypothetical protein